MATTATNIDIDTAALEVHDLRIRYGRFEVVHNVSLHVNPGEVVAVLGPNGAGKTTLLRGIAGVVAPESGRVNLFGEDATDRSGAWRARAGFRLVPEGRELFPSLNVVENLRVAAFHHRRRRAEVRAEIDRALDLFPRLRERARQVVGTLSGGEQQMLAIARALMFSPRVILFDEISLGLAPIKVAELYEVLTARVREDGISVVIVEQLFELARQVADRAYVMETGQLTPINLSSTTEAELMAAYLGAAPL
jgi:branched-chain amino acid transport system ATP-binding protein